MEPEDLLLCSQELATEPYTEPVEFSQNSRLLSTKPFEIFQNLRVSFLWSGFICPLYNPQD